MLHLFGQLFITIDNDLISINYLLWSRMSAKTFSITTEMGNTNLSLG